MADSVIVKVSELRSLLQDIRRDGMDYVRVSLIDEDDLIKDDVIPASVSLSACKHYKTTEWTVYDEIYATDNSKELENDYLTGLKASSGIF